MGSSMSRHQNKHGDFLFSRPKSPRHRSPTPYPHDRRSLNDDNDSIRVLSKVSSIAKPTQTPTKIAERPLARQHISFEDKPAVIGFEVHNPRRLNRFERLTN
ncbi:hypothetical protein SMACR_06393 [Sordaria macrospora]|uniref:WGS project CABT00000000 data, contig 2.35 n=2 Tax=Sordaria macrospora TaxID=5147 RepID=F7W6N5_SORMK|nr:uncharacterized protein SMAC_06393 [Sordaria macrospora k-hell]KAA8628168.1 hypothetical protein SMACR_06393 [Sordaria macrospora]KAH7628258.1 hypothetical protein B0T09DRAFT_385657 [Sordaria sp. MPI-SDFR-AT-0083]WPJ65708.1 hypothetical protein SMAC4_06393 [Sordaria macrospora]CCC13174.1 unnamed protein product [Sordaria macrospora k-hell]